MSRSGGRDLPPLSERPGYNANPNDWVRYANYLENRVAALDEAQASEEMAEIIADWFTFAAARRWIDGTLAAPDEDAS